MKRIKTPINDDYTVSASQHISSSDLPETYSTDGNYIYKLVTDKEYMEMLNSMDGVVMVELGLEATLDTNYDG